MKRSRSLWDATNAKQSAATAKSSLIAASDTTTAAMGSLVSTGDVADDVPTADEFGILHFDATSIAELPDDTLAALQMLRSECRTLVAVKSKNRVQRLFKKATEFQLISGVPVVLVSAIYAVLRGDKMAVDMSIVKLQDRGVVRICHAPTGLSDTAVVFREDIDTYVSIAKKKMDEAQATALGVYMDAVAGYHEPWIQREVLLELIEQIRHKDMKRLRAISADTAEAMAVKLGLLTGRNDGGAVTGFRTQSYWFGVPESVHFWKYIESGRAELVMRLTKRRYHEMSRPDVYKMRFARSPLSAVTHLRDIIGRGEAQEVETAAGPFIRLRS